MSLNQIMNISTQAMSSNQIALTVVSHNIANVNTDGYSKQRAEFQESIVKHNLGGVYSLNGTAIGSITSYASNTIGAAIMGVNSDYNYFKTLTGVNSTLENIVDEMGEYGLGKTISEFFSAAQHLNSYPTDIGARQNYVQCAQDILSKLTSISKTIDNTTENLIGNYLEPASMKTSQLGLSLEDVNQRLQSLGDINLQIAKCTTTDQGGANGLIDQRNRILDEISQYVPINVSVNSNSTVNVTIGNAVLVKGAEVTGTLELNAGTIDEPAAISVKDKDGKTIYGNINSEISSGSVGAILKSVGKSSDGFVSLRGMQENLDTLINDFAEEVNAIQLFNDPASNMQAMCLDDSSGEMILIPSTEPIFKGGPPYTVKSVKINEEILKNPNLIAAARVDNTTDYEKNIGNSDNVMEIIGLRDKKITHSPGSTSSLPDVTLDRFITNLATKLGLQGSDLESKADSKELVLATLSNERKATTGVNMDEELADMIRYQRAYEASARVFSTANDVFQVLVNLGR